MKRIVGFALAFATLASAAHAHFLFFEVSTTSGKATAGFAETGLDEALNIVVPAKDKIKWRNVSDPTVSGNRLQFTTKGGPFGADWDYGLLDKSKEGRGIFQLHFFAKGALTLADAKRKLGQPLEITVGGNGGAFVASVWKDGRPLGKADVVMVTDEEEGIKLKTDFRGNVQLPANTVLPIALRAFAAESKSGSPEVKSYATLVVGKRFVDAPVADPAANPVAYRILRSAVEYRVKIPAAISITGHVQFTNQSGSHEGDFTFNVEKGVEFGKGSLIPDDMADLRSLFLHRTDSPFDNGDGGNPLGLGARQLGGIDVLLNDANHSGYRLEAGQIQQVNRTMGSIRLCVDIAENRVLDDGRYLPKFFVAHTYGADGSLIKSIRYVDTYSDVQGVWLPLERKIVSVGKDGIRPSVIRFTNLVVK